MINRLYKHKQTGNLYVYLGYIKYKDEVTREWVNLVSYKDTINNAKYCRTIQDFDNNFEELKN